MITWATVKAEIEAQTGTTNAQIAAKLGVGIFGARDIAVITRLMFAAGEIGRVPGACHLYVPAKISGSNVTSMVARTDALKP